METHPEQEFVVNGMLRCDDYDCEFVKEDGRVVTVQYCTAQIDPDYLEKKHERKHIKQRVVEGRLYRKGQYVTKKQWR